MQERFRLVIDLGNEACQSKEDVASILRKVAFRVEHLPEDSDYESALVKDANGNTVGEWMFCNEGQD